MARRFGVSRTPTREALRRLEAEKLVQRDGAGLVVSDFSREAGSEVMLIRQLLEPHAGETSAPALTPADLAHLDSLIRAMDALRRAAPPIEHAELNNRFHAVLYARCPYPLLLDEVRRVREHYVTYWLYETYTEADALLVNREHRRIAGIARRIAERKAEPSQIREALDRHIGDARRRFDENVRGEART